MEKTVNTATQGADNSARLHLSTFNELLDVSKFPLKKDDDGEPYTESALLRKQNVQAQGQRLVRFTYTESLT